MTWQDFEELGRGRMAEHYGVPRLTKRPVVSASGVVVRFDGVADDESVVGDFKNLSTADSGKRAGVSECIWLLQDVPKAEHRFIVFGVNRRLADAWLNRFRARATGIEFFFLSDDGQITRL
jgi:hypothetical protein